MTFGLDLEKRVSVSQDRVCCAVVTSKSPNLRGLAQQKFHTHAEVNTDITGQEALLGTSPSPGD